MYKPFNCLSLNDSILCICILTTSGIRPYQNEDTHSTIHNLDLGYPSSHIYHAFECSWHTVFGILPHGNISVITTAIRAQNFPLGIEKLACVTTANPNPGNDSLTIRWFCHSKPMSFTFYPPEVQDISCNVVNDII